MEYVNNCVVFLLNIQLSVILLDFSTVLTVKLTFELFWEKRSKMLEVFSALENISFEKLIDVYRNDIKSDAITTDIQPKYNVEGKSTQNDFYEYLQTDFFSGKNRFYCVWVEDNVYRAALRIEPYKDGYLFHALQTHPSYRRQGYAEKLVTATLAYLSGFGNCVVYSHVYKNNQPSMQLHKKCGFIIQSDCAHFLDGTVTNRASTFVYNV